MARRGDDPDERGVVAGGGQPGEQVRGGLGGGRARTGLGEAEVVGVLLQRPPQRVDRRLQLTDLLPGPLGQRPDVAGEQHVRHPDSEQGGDPLPGGRELVGGRQLLRPQGVAGADPVEVGRVDDDPVVRPGPVGEQRVGGDDEVAHRTVEPGRTQLADPAAHVLDGEVAGHAVHGRLLVDTPPPVDRERERPVADLAQLQAVHDAADDRELLGLDDRAPLAGLHRLGDPAQRGPQVGERDRPAGPRRVEVRVARVQGREQAVDEQLRVVLERRAAGRARLEVRLQRLERHPVVEVGPDGARVGPGDPVGLRERGA